MRQQKCERYDIQTTEGLVREEDWMDLLFGWESIAFNFKVTWPKRDCIHLGDMNFNMKYQQQYYKGLSGKFWCLWKMGAHGGFTELPGTWTIICYQSYTMRIAPKIKFNRRANIANRFIPQAKQIKIVI